MNRKKENVISFIRIKDFATLCKHDFGHDIINKGEQADKQKKTGISSGSHRLL